MGNTSTNITDPSHGDPNSNPPVQGTNPPSHGDAGSLEALKLQLADLQRKNAEFLADNAKYRKKQKEQEEAALLSAQKQLEEQGQFKALAEQHAARVQELEPVAQRYHDLSLLVAGQIEDQIKDWPTEIKAFDPGNDAPVEERLAWIEKSRPIITKLQQQGQGQRPGNAPNPVPGSPTRQDQQNAFMQKLRQSGKYGG